VVTAIYLQNRLPMKCLVDRTPYEAWHGRKLAVNHLRVFGCRAFVKQLGHVDKLIDRSYAGVFIGYTEGAKAYRILDLALGMCAWLGLNHNHGRVTGGRFHHRIHLCRGIRSGSGG
jgi:hypothetical protein